MRALLIPAGEDLYAVDTERVREVVAGPEPTVLPSAPRWVLGVINVRGEIVPLLDTAAMLGVGNSDQPAFAVVVRSAAGPAALTATAIPEFATLGTDLGVAALPGTVSRHRLGQRLVVRIDVDALVTLAHGEAPSVAVDAP